VLIFCALNTIIGYWAFTQSMRHIDTTKISTIIATIPLITIAATYLAFIIWPNYIQFDQINFLGWLGIFLVVTSVIVFNRQSKQIIEEELLT
jgi:drug/metabolite transporter (DMT)-like permease